MNPKNDISTKTQDIFRASALQHMDTLEEVPLSLKIIHPSAWLWIIAVTSALIGLITWSLFGTVSVTISTTGIIMPDASHMIAISGTSAGTVSKLNVSQGQWVRRGEILAHISNLQIQEELRHSKAIYTANAITLSKWIDKYNIKKKELIDHFSSRTKSLTFIIKNHRNMINTLHHLLQSREKLYRQGYLSKIDFEKYRLEYFLAQEKLSSLQNELTEAESVFGSALQALQDKKIDLTRQYTESMYALRQKEIENKLGSSIISPADGTLTGINITQGEYFTPKKIIFTLAAHPKNNHLHILAFINAAQGKSVTKGMLAHVVPESLSGAEHGYIDATVYNISDYPITKETAALYLGNDAMVDTFFRHGAPFLADLSFRSGTAPATAGTITTVKIIIHRFTPIKLLMTHLN